MTLHISTVTLSKCTFRDCEGEQGLLTVFNVYCVRADPERDDRKAFKLQFYKLLQNRAEAILKTGRYTYNVIKYKN